MRKVPPTVGLTVLFMVKCALGQSLGAMQACTHLREDAARLSCYDVAMGVSKAASGNQPAPASEAGASPGKFGDDGRLHTESKATLPKHLTAQITGVALLPAGMYRLTLDNGQVWDTTQADSALSFKANDSISISRGLLGSYQISLAGHTTSVSAVRKQ